MVRQHGTFYTDFKTYGCEIAHPDKKRPMEKQPTYGPWRPAEGPKKGYNCTINALAYETMYSYLEEGPPEKEQTVYRKNVKHGIWKDPTNYKTMMNATVMHN